jgi:serine/threonine protein phosphatase PrpC
MHSGEDEWRGPAAGCTAVCALVAGNQLVVANAGDSRCVLSRAGKAVALTEDHKPTNDEEFSRIMKAGGFVADGRVNGSLNLSRALGDLEYKQVSSLPPEEQMVTANPEIRSLRLTDDDEFLILACDGIWDVLTNDDAVAFVRERLIKGFSPKQICEEACDYCLAEDTGGCGKGCDNMSIVISVFKNSKFAQSLK